MKVKTSLIIFTLLLSISMFSQTKEEKKAIKEEKAQNEYVAIKKLMESENYIFEGQWANTQRGKRIDISSNANMLKMEAKSADAYLSFFGVSQSAGYGSGGAIEFKGSVYDYTLEFDDKKRKVIVKFKAKNNSENYDVMLEVFGNGNSSLNINSNKRNSMRYSGKTSAL